MDVDDPNFNVENVTKDTVQLSPNKSDDLKNGEPNVETSMDQQKKKLDDVESPEDESAHENESEQKLVSGDKEKQTRAKKNEVETDPKEDVAGKKDEENVVDVDDIDSDDVPLGRKFGESVAKRLRSSKGNAVPFEVEKARTKNVGIGPKKGWTKLKVKTAAGRTKKRKIASMSESKNDVDEDAVNIISSTKQKSAGKKNVQTVENIPMDKVSFHLPENAQRWKFINHRRLALERELGKEALEIEAVMELIKEAGLVNISTDCDNPLSREYQNVYVRGECVNFSANIINKFLGVKENKFL
jgi:hypothetical protein